MNTPITSFTGHYSFLSNFYPAPVAVSHGTYHTAEHAFQASKAAREEDRQRIRATETPQKAKKIGRSIKLRDNWERIKVGFMKECVRAKFKDLELQRKLLETGDRELIEGNWWGDKYWGVCNGVGKNMLGRILMSVRDELRNGRVD